MKPTNEQIRGQEVGNALILLHCMTRDILGELLNNMDKDLSKNKHFWEDMDKKYGTAIEKLKG